MGFRLLSKTHFEFRTDFVALLADAGADCGIDSVTPSAQPCHRRDHGLDNSGQCAVPTCMRRTNDPGLAVGEEKRRAIGG